MKTVKLTIREFYVFKQLANFFFTMSVIHGIVEITANIEHLEKLGY